jgi:hypothetical protein
LGSLLPHGDPFHEPGQVGTGLGALALVALGLAFAMWPAIS